VTSPALPPAIVTARRSPSIAEAKRAYEEQREWDRHPVGRMIPSRYRACSFRNVESTPAVLAARAHCLEDAYACTCLVLSGGVGVGKTVAAACAARYLCVEASTDEVRFYSAGSLISRLLDPATRSEAMRAAVEADELLVDDVGSSYLKRDGLAVGLFEEIVIAREADQAPMFITTNLGPEHFRAVLGARVYDRIRGPWGRWVDVDGPSRRRKRGQP
jgi:DNA replication protein DnaC